MTRLLKAISNEELQECFKQWKRRWTKCVGSNRNYFENDNVNFNEN